MKTEMQTVQEWIDGKEPKCPFDLGLIPNTMGINLCDVDFVTWSKLDNGQLTSLAIQFKPDAKNVGMSFSIALDALKAGKCIRRKGTPKLSGDVEVEVWSPNMEEIHATDWEIAE